MKKQVLCWLPVIKQNVRGINYANGYPDVIAARYKGTLLENILAMPEGNPVSFEKAVLLAYDMHSKAIDENRIGYAIGECNWYEYHFVEWISSLGLQIILTGDEFELWQEPDRAA